MVRRANSTRADFCNGRTLLRTGADLYRQGIRPPLGRGRRHELARFQDDPVQAEGFSVADEEHLTRIENVPIREFMRRGIKQHTLEKIRRICESPES